MASGPYSFIDIAVLEPVRGRFADGDALAILTIDLLTVIWANGPGAALLGNTDIEASMGAPSGLALPARRQISATPGFPRTLHDRSVAVRIASGTTSRLANFVISGISLPDGEAAILLAEPAPKLSSLKSDEIAGRVIEGIGEAGYFAALLDERGSISACSDGFDQLGITAEALSTLTAEVAAEEDRLVKRLVPSASGLIPAGIARLRDEPATHLLIAIEETADTAEILREEASESAHGLESTLEGEMQDVVDPENGSIAAAAGKEEAESKPDGSSIPAEPTGNVIETSNEHSAPGNPSREVAPLRSAGPASGERPPSKSEEADHPAIALDASDQRFEQEASSDDAVELPEEAAPQEPADVAGVAAEPGDGTNTPTVSDSDDWYFSKQVNTASRSSVVQPENIAASTINRHAGPVRFVWRTDATGSFSMISPEFAAAVGTSAADVMGQPFATVASRFGLDPEGEIGRLLEHRDTWSGRTVLWPVEGTDLVVPVDLAALPNYGRDRSFEGFRGFGVARMADAIVDPSAIGLRIGSASPRPIDDGNQTGGDTVAPNPDQASAIQPDSSQLQSDAEVDTGQPVDEQTVRDPFHGEVPVISIADRRERRISDKVIRLAEHRTTPATGQLSAGERSAFEEIRDRLRRDYETADDKDEGAQTEATEEEAGSQALADAELPTGVNAPEVDEPRAEAVEDDGFGGVGDDHHDLGDLAVLDGFDDPASARYEELQDDRPEEAETAGSARVPTSDASSGRASTGDVTPSPIQNNDEADSEISAYREATEAEHKEARELVDERSLGGSTTPDNVDLAPNAPHSIENAQNEEGPPRAGTDESDNVAIDQPVPSAEISTRTDVGMGTDTDDAVVEADTSADDGAAGPSGVVVDSGRAAGLEQSVVKPSLLPAIETAGYLPSAFGGDVRRAALDSELIAGLPLPILVHAGDDLYFANREFLALTGYASLDQIRREGGLDRLFADGEPRIFAGEDGRKLRLRTLGGEVFPVDAHLQSVRWMNGSALLLALRRTPQQIAAQSPLTAPVVLGIEEMERRVAEMRTIIDTATDGVVLMTPDGTIRSISRPAEALFGFDSADVEGKPFHTLFAIESQRSARDYLNGLADNGVASVLNDGREVIGREAEGRFIPLFMTIGRLPQESGFCAVVRDITQWKRAEEDLTQARAQAERASSQKTEFLARVSHEVRTPLNAIIGFSELMIDEKFGPIHNDRYRDYLRDINRSGNHVLDLVNDLLDISKIEAGEQEMNYEAVSLNDTLAESVAMMQPQANRDRVIIRSSLASRVPDVVADLRSVRQIALNLLSNAIRYTQAGGQVIVSTSYEPSGDVVMRVRDTGIGMTLMEIDQALKPFKQINALKRGRHDGTGLGLPLTKAMVEANRARFAISSTPGEGTMVEITFPSTRVLAD